MQIIALAAWLSFPGYGYWIARIKKRSPIEGFFVGLFLGPIGCILEATRRELTLEQIEEKEIKAQADAEAKAQTDQERLTAYKAEVAESQLIKIELAEEARASRQEAFSRFSTWFDRVILKFGWFKALPEVAQPIVVGIMLGVPAVVILIFFMKAR